MRPLSLALCPSLARAPGRSGWAPASAITLSIIPNYSQGIMGSITGSNEFLFPMNSFNDSPHEPRIPLINAFFSLEFCLQLFLESVIIKIIPLIFLVPNYSIDSGLEYPQ